MKGLIYIPLLFFLTSCDNEQSKISDNSNTHKPKGDSTFTDSVLTFQYKVDVSNINITNKSDRQVDLLFNGVDNFLGGQKNMEVGFSTECMICEPVQRFQSGLLFAKRLLLKPNEITYYKNDFDIPDSLNEIKVTNYYGERKKMNFHFDGGKGTMKYLGQSCNDADYDKVQLMYETGILTIDSILNSSFFEYDLDSNGQMEQYLLGTRNCSQELVILRITKRTNK